MAKQNKNGKKQPGQTRKTPNECREAFTDFVNALEVEGLRLEVTESGRCSVNEDIDGLQTRRVLGPVAGNTFVKMLSGVRALAPHARKVA